MTALSIVVDADLERLRIARHERAYVGAIVHMPDLHADVELGHLTDPHAREAYAALANLRARGEAVTMESVRTEIQRDREVKQGRLCDVRELSWFADEIEIVEAKPASLVAGWAHTIIQRAADRAEDEERYLAREREQQEIDAVALRELDPGGAPPHVEPTAQGAPRPRWHRCLDLVDAILARANETWIALKLGADELVRARPGAMVVLMGPTGAGKTSLAAGILIAHVDAGGVAIVLSRELPGDELVARVIGMQTDASWTDVLTGQVPRARMLMSTSDRMLVLDREDATLDALDAAIHGARAAYPGAPILVVIDYVQILDSTERDARARVADIIARIDRIARAHRVVVLALSQMSRAASRAARNGEAMGAESTDGGAESAAIERAATVTLAIGTAGEEREDGTRAVEVSIGKGRMTGGDRVLPMSYDGRTGRWRMAGDARPAAEVRAERATETTTALVAAAQRAMVAGAAASAEPVTRARLADMAVSAMGRCPREVQRQAVARALASRELVEVEVRAHKARHPMIWTPDRAAAAGVPLAGGTP